MLYIDFEADRKAYKLRLTTRDVVALEKRLGCNPLSVFGAGDTIPSVTQMVAILHASLQTYQHGVTYENTLDIFDSWLADGHVMTDFIPTILDIYRTGGLIAPEKRNVSEAEEDEKN
jgi:hypothetical protein